MSSARSVVMVSALSLLLMGRAARPGSASIGMSVIKVPAPSPKSQVRVRLHRYAVGSWTVVTKPRRVHCRPAVEVKMFQTLEQLWTWRGHDGRIVDVWN